MTTEEGEKVENKRFTFSYNLTYIDEKVEVLPAKEVIIVFRDGLEVVIHCDFISIKEQVFYFYTKGAICSIVPLANILHTTSKTARGEPSE